MDISNIRIDNDGHEISFFDTIPSKLHNPEKDFEIKAEKFQRRNTILLRLKKLETCFLAKQKRTQAYLSSLLTFHLFNDLQTLRSQKIRINFTFLNEKLFNELESLTDTERFPKQQDIAKRFGKDKSDASRTLNNFLKILEKVSTL